MKSDLYSVKEVREMPDKKAENLFLKLYHKEKKGPTHHPRDNTMKKSRMDRLEERMDRLDAKVDQIRMTVDKLAKIVNDGFSELRQDIKDINVRLDRVEQRLDYNGLKQLPNNK